jgi:uncharacterized membrane protein YfcA
MTTTGIRYMAAFGFGFIAATLVLRYLFDYTAVQAIGTGLFAGVMSMGSTYISLRRQRGKQDGDGEAEA